jgi:CheY-like chemotaxis protein
MERVRRLLLLGHDMAFTVASAPEIEAALRTHCGLEIATVAPDRQRFPDLAQVRAGRRQREQMASSAPSDKGLPYEEISGALIRMATLAADLYLEKDPDGLRVVRARVRYASLLASRLNMGRSAADRVTMAAWLSAFDTRPEMLRSIEGLCGLRDLLQDTGAPAERQSQEQCVLALARAYVDLRERNPSVARDVAALRGLLRNTWSAAVEMQPMLETFLQSLADETFMDTPPVSGGVLAIGASPGLALVLRREDLRVESVADEADAWIRIGRNPPDLIVAAAEALAGDGREFCRRLRADPAAARVPLILLEPEGAEAQAARHLRAGATDALVRPVDPELLLAKVQKLIGEKAEPGTGVSGSLEEMSFSDMMQVLCVGGRTAEVMLSRGDAQGRVYLVNGDVIHAVAGERVGEEAFYALMQWKTGAFQTVRCTTMPARSIHASVMSLLMEGARRADEEPAA